MDAYGTTANKGNRQLKLRRQTLTLVNGERETYVAEIFSKVKLGLDHVNVSKEEIAMLKLGGPFVVVRHLGNALQGIACFSEHFVACECKCHAENGRKEVFTYVKDVYKRLERRVDTDSLAEGDLDAGMEDRDLKFEGRRHMEARQLGIQIPGNMGGAIMPKCLGARVN
mmetsp:Transcript_5760/g.18184  ORF Transcript_5760/g.18184 Transcript_5760/m.18184 type:complete len:169 (+) Transcript_5760:883-1389(+)